MELHKNKENNIKRYSVIVPLYNEEEIFEELYVRLRKTMEGLGESFELIFVDDGSKDKTYGLICQYAKKDNNIIVIKLTRNFGQENSIVAGIKNSNGEEIILMDGDLQDPPEIIPELIEKKKEGYDVVYAIKSERKEGLLKRFLIRSFYKMMYFVSKAQIPMNSGIFSVIGRSVGMHIANFPESGKHISGLRTLVGYRQCGVSYKREARKKGSGKTIFELFRMGLNAFFQFSIFPIRMVVLLTVIITILNMAVFLGLLVQYIISKNNVTLNSAPFLMIYLLFQNSAIIAILLIMSEYMGRTQEQIKGRPDYFVESIIKNGTLYKEYDDLAYMESSNNKAALSNFDQVKER